MEYDLIIVGTGAGGGTLAYALASSGKKILLIERGGFLPREKENWNVRSVFLENRYKTQEVWHDHTGRPLHPGTHYYVGGNTKVYGAALLRLRERDFERVDHHGGVSPEWPLKYRAFQPYYQRAEELYQVHGKRGSDPLDPPESSPFPHPALLHEPRIQGIFDALQTKGLHPFPLPLGLLRNEARPEESACIRCDTCDGFPCLVDAKADAEIACVNPALQYPNVTLLTHTTALRLEIDASGRKVTRLIVERQGKEESYSAALYVLSCGAINSAALLLRSNLANSSGQVGRNYMCHTNTAMIALSKTPNPTQFQKTLGLNDFYFESSAWRYPMGHIQLLGNIKPDMLRGGAPFFIPDAALRFAAHHAVGWWLSSEDLPDPENRVTLGPQGGIVLRYTPNNEKGHQLLLKKLKSLLNSMELTFSVAKRIPIEGVAHQVGTCRFGTDPATSVLDLNCKTHDVDNLYVVDGSFFPSSGATNPALTIAANALRVADHLKQGC